MEVSPFSDGYTEFLTSLESQLEFANLDTTYCSAQTIRDIVHSCPNMRCDFEWELEKGQTESVVALGDPVRRLTIRAGNDETVDILEAASACTKVEEILFATYRYSEMTSSSFVKALRLEEKPCLSSLKLMMKNCGVLTDAVRLAGHCSGALRVFQMQCSLQKRGAFDGIAKSSPLLEEVHDDLLLHKSRANSLDGHRELFADASVHMMSSFSVCSVLR